jgi:hypothetical protein
MAHSSDMDSVRLGLPIMFGMSVAVALLARRWLPARSPAATWLAGLPIAVIPVATIWAGASLLSTSALLGGTFIVGGIVFLTLWAVYTHRSVAKVRAARNDAEIEAALEEPLVDMSIVWAGLLLLGGFLAIGLILVGALVLSR